LIEPTLSYSRKIYIFNIGIFYFLKAWTLAYLASEITLEVIFDKQLNSLPHLFDRLFICLFIYLKTVSYYVAQTGLELIILLPQPLQCRITGMYHHTWLLGSFIFSQIIIYFFENFRHINRERGICFSHVFLLFAILCVSLIFWVKIS
jgi:hypothetical protein